MYVNCMTIFTRDSIYATARICHTNSVCLSGTRVICVKTAERIIKILSPSDRPIILVFRHQGPLRRSGGFTPIAGAKYKGVAIFDQCGYILEMVIDRGIVTMEDEYSCMRSIE